MEVTRRDWFIISGFNQKQVINTTRILTDDLTTEEHQANRQLRLPGRQPAGASSRSLTSSGCPSRWAGRHVPHGPGPGACSP